MLFPSPTAAGVAPVFQTKLRLGLVAELMTSRIAPFRLSLTGSKPSGVVWRMKNARVMLPPDGV